MRIFGRLAAGRRRRRAIGGQQTVEIPNRLRQTFFELNSRLPTEEFPRLRYVGLPLLGIVGR
jgi:hypothetical protein